MCKQRNVRTRTSLSLSRVENKKAYSTTVHSSTVDILIDGFIRPHDWKLKSSIIETIEKGMVRFFDWLVWCTLIGLKYDWKQV
jgi:hypothetical protein